MHSTLNRIKYLLITVVALIILGCGGGGSEGIGGNGWYVGTGMIVSADPDLLATGFSIGFDDSQQLFVYWEEKTGELFPDEVRFTAPTGVFQPFTPITLPNNFTGDTFQANVVVTSLPGTGTKTGTITATAYHNGSPHPGYATRTIFYTVTAAPPTNLTLVDFHVVTDFSTPNLPTKSIVITLDEPLDPGKTARFKLISNQNPAVATILNINYPSTQISYTPDPLTGSTTNYLTRNIEIALLDHGDVNDTVVNQHLAYGPGPEPLDGTYTGTFTHNGQQGTISITIEDKAVSGVGGVTATSTQFLATITINHPDGNASGTDIIPQLNGDLLQWELSGQPLGSYVGIRLLQHTDTINTMHIQLMTTNGDTDEDIAMSKS